MTHSTGSPDSGSDNGTLPTSIIVAVVFIAIAAIGGVVYLTAIGRPVDNIIVLVGALITPTVVSLLAVRHGAANSKKLDAISQQVDGKIDNLITDKARLEHQVTAMGGAPITLPQGFRPLGGGRTDTTPQAQVKDQQNG